jgi:hypothetical protein
MPRIGELIDRLLSQASADMHGPLVELLDLLDTYHRQGVARLLEMIRAWRGDIFLDALVRDDIAGPFISSYHLGGPA